MYDRCKHDSNGAQENNATKNGITAGKDLSSIRMEFVGRAHARKNHGCVIKRSHPVQLPEIFISDHTQEETDQDQYNGIDKKRELAFPIGFQIQQWFFDMFKLKMRFAHGSRINKRVYNVRFILKSTLSATGTSIFIWGSVLGDPKTILAGRTPAQIGRS